MPGDVLYLDSSALAKLIVSEPETDETVEECAHWPVHASSIVAAVEVHLALRRSKPDEPARRRADQVLAALDLVPLDDVTAARASALEAAPQLRALDAIHLASALALDDDLGALLTFDRRQREAAEAAGVATLPRR
jgi:predicted nucleic acid-binding protein